MTNTNNPAAGWYPDPQNPMQQRLWDGATWTDQTRPSLPGQVPGMPAGQRPNNYLVWSIITTVCCCIPFGIPAIVNAAKVEGAWNRGDISAAMRHSAQAKKFTIIAASVGAALAVLSFVLQILVAYYGS